MIFHQKQVSSIIQKEAWDICSHVWFMTSWSSGGVFYGCVKCQLNEIVLDSYSTRGRYLTESDRFMYQYIRKHPYPRDKGIFSNMKCDFDLAIAVCRKIQEHYPDISDELLLKYMEIALIDILSIPVNDYRKESRIKRLSLDPKVNYWNNSSRIKL